jgi:diguanylate cyclase (GGDEF)-like protein
MISCYLNILLESSVNIKVKLVSSFGLVIVGMLISLGVITYLTFSEAIKKDRYNYFESRTQNVCNVVNTFLDRELEVVQHIYQPMVSGNSVIRPDSGRMDQIRKHIAKHPIIEGMSLFSSDGTNQKIECGVNNNLQFPVSSTKQLQKPATLLMGQDLVVLLPIENETTYSPSGFIAAVKIKRDKLEQLFAKQVLAEAMLVVTLKGQPVFSYLSEIKNGFSGINLKVIESGGFENSEDLKKQFKLFSCEAATLNFKITYIVPNSAMLSEIVILKDRVVTALLLLGWVSIWLVLMIAHRLTGPIIKLSKATEDIVSFSYGEPLDFSTSKDEIGKLAENFEKMRLKIKEMISVDPLTKVYNRRHLMRALDIAVSKSIRTEEDLSCIMLDVDYFKKINDSYGHLGGDEVLAVLGNLLKIHLRPYDVVARFGGEEFALLLPGASILEASETAERIRQIAEAESIRFKTGVIRFTLSAGVASLSTLQIKTPDALVDSADIALYRAKRDGRNRVQVFEGDKSPI